MSSDDSKKDSNNTPKRVFRPNSTVNRNLDTPEDHNLFISVTLLRTGEIVYLDRISTNLYILERHYRVKSGKVYFMLDPLGQLATPNNIRLGLNDATDKYLAMGRTLSTAHYFLYYTGSEPVGYSFPDVNITVFIATDEEEKAWNIPPQVPLVNKTYCFWDNEADEGNDEGASDSMGKEKGELEGEDEKREKRLYEPRPPFAANPGPYVVEKWEDGREKQGRKCVIS